MIDELEQTKAELAIARAETERLHAMMAGEVDAMEFTSMIAKEGEIELCVRPPHWAVKALAGSFAESLGEAPNWRSIVLGPMPDGDGGMISVTVQRLDGQTPVETAGELRECLSLMLGHVQRLHGGGTLGLGGIKDFARASALIRAGRDAEKKAGIT